MRSFFTGFNHSSIKTSKRRTFFSPFSPITTFKNSQRYYAIEINEFSPRLPKKRVALELAYCGTNYQGMQINAGQDTIDSRLQEALYRAGGVSFRNKDSLTKIGYSRCSRTDKGVHALTQIVSLKILMNELSTMGKRLNDNLPPDIRVIGIRGVTSGFSPRFHCEARTYEYLIPSYSISPLAIEPNFDLKSFKIDSSSLNSINEYMKLFIGTKSYHNYTRFIPSKSKSFYGRLLKEFNCKVYPLNGVEYLHFTIYGQSFLYHQIRKMIGTIVGVVREGLDENTILETLNYVPRPTPLAPSVGLFLSKVHFDSYTEKWYDHLNENTHYYDEEVANSFRERIYQQISNDESAILEWMKDNKSRVSKNVNIEQDFEEYDRCNEEDDESE